MASPITTAGQLAGEPLYYEAPFGKQAVLPVTVTTKHRDPQTADWIADSPVTYQVIVTDDESLAVAASLAPGDLVLLSGTLRDDATAVIDAETLLPGVRSRHRT